jgi:predicted metal-binding membrane protein
VLILLNTQIRRHRRRMSTALGVLALAGVLVLAHSTLGSGRMGHVAGHPMSVTIDAIPSDDVLAMCLAVAETAALGFGLLAAIGAWRVARITSGAPATCPAMQSITSFARPSPAARAGPADLQVFLR